MKFIVRFLYVAHLLGLPLGVVHAQSNDQPHVRGGFTLQGWEDGTRRLCYLIVDQYGYDSSIVGGRQFFARIRLSPGAQESILLVASLGNSMSSVDASGVEDGRLQVRLPGPAHVRNLMQAHLYELKDVPDSQGRLVRCAKLHLIRDGSN